MRIEKNSVSVRPYIERGVLESDLPYEERSERVDLGSLKMRSSDDMDR